MSEIILKRNATLKTQKRALDLSPSSIIEEDRTVEVIFTSGAAVKRHTWDGHYTEVLTVTTDAVDLTRLNAGAPVLNTHSSYELDDVIGVVVSAWIDGGKGYARLKFSERPEADLIWNDVKAGILRNISVGYTIEEHTQSEANGEITLTATKWTPVEISLVPVPADAGAQVRSLDTSAGEIAVEIDDEAKPEEEAPAADEAVVEATEENTTAAEEASQEAPVAGAEEADVTEGDPVPSPADASQSETDETKSEDQTTVAAPLVDAVRASSALIVRTCLELNISHKAADFIESGASIEDVRSYVKSTEEIRSLCVRAKMPNKAEDFIAKGLDLNAVRKALLDSMVEKDEQINSAFVEESEEQRRAAEKKARAERLSANNQLRRFNQNLRF